MMCSSELAQNLIILKRIWLHHPKIYLCHKWIKTYEYQYKTSSSV
jgi:hypothetical protein